MTVPDCYYISQDTAFGHTLVRRQWPLITSQAIDNVNASIALLDATRDAAKVNEGKQLIQQLEKLKYEVENNKKLSPIPVPEDYQYADLREYNYMVSKLLKADAETVHWRQGAWLFTECYFYRRLIAIFQASKYWTDYDCFTASKRSAFETSKIAVLDLAVRYQRISEQLLHDNEYAKFSEESKLELLENTFRELVDIALWGNSIDLALLAHVKMDEIKNLQGSQSQNNDSKVLVNHTSKVWTLLKSRFGKTDSTRIDFVLDNAGFELFTDVVLALFFLDSGLANSVVFQPKTYPCFVSDVINKDFDYLLEDMKNPTFFGSDVSESQKQALQYLAARFEHYQAKQKQEGAGISIHNHIFWNTYYQFNRDLTPNGHGGGAEAWKDLSASDLVVFKGDMNHRKLLGDLQWKRTTPFSKALALQGTAKESLGNSGIKLVSFRTIKSNPLTGLREGQEAEMNEMWWNEQGKKGDRRVVEQGWQFSTKWALIEYSEGAME